MTTKLTELEIQEGSLVDKGANQEARVVLFKRADIDKAEWTAAYVNDLPDSSFAAIEPGGKKDAEGKTMPRSLRHLPYKDAEGKVDAAHVRNALARMDQTDMSAEMKAMARRKLEAAAKEMGMDVGGNVGGQRAGMEGDKRAHWLAAFGKRVLQAFGLADTELDALTDSALGKLDQPQVTEPAGKDGEKMDDTVTKVETAPQATPQAEDIAKRLADLEAEREELRKRAETAEAEIAKANADKAAAEDIAKAERERAEMVELTKRCEAWANVAKADELAAILKAAPTPEYAAKLESLFDVAHKRIEKGDLFAEKGSDQPAESGVVATVAKRAKEAVAKGEYPTEAQAIDAIISKDTELQAEYLRETRSK